MQLQQEPHHKSPVMFVREFPLMSAKLACYMYNQFSEREKSDIQIKIKEQNDYRTSKRFKFISTTSFNNIKTEEAKRFVYDFSIMTIESAYSKYQKLNIKDRDAIIALIEANESSRFKNLFAFIVKALPDVKEIIFSLLFEDCLSLKNKSLSLYQEMPLSGLFPNSKKFRF